MPNENPILSDTYPTPFHQIRAEHIGPAVRHALQVAEEEIGRIEERDGLATYENTLLALSLAVERVSRVVTVAYHLLSVRNSPELRNAVQEVEPEIGRFYAAIPLRPRLWERIREVAESGAVGLSPTHGRHLEKTVREFRRSGAELDEASKERVREIEAELTSLGTSFANNVLDATSAFTLRISDEAELAGLPESAIRAARRRAEAMGEEGWVFTLHAPSYTAFMRYGAHREHRRTLYEAYMNRASMGENDNGPLIERILELRQELASILGFDTYAELATEDTMAASADTARQFVERLERETRPYWEKEMDDLEAYARSSFGYDRLEPWDVAYAIEKISEERLGLRQEELRPYFELNRVQRGLFEIAGELFGVEIEERQTESVWHPSVRFYEVRREGRHIGSFFVDWFPRDDKRDGAWMNSFITGGPRPDGTFRPHLAVIAGNFNEPDEEGRALLTHREVQTIFHEFGHLLHQCLSEVDVPDLAGTRVSRDWVELPSQLMENWTWEKEALDRYAIHVDTGEPIPGELYERLARSRAFFGAYAQMRQLSFATVDLALHERGEAKDAVAFAREVMARFAPDPSWADNDFVKAFTHIFSGGYSAGYYSYKWAEVLEADAFSRFRDAGIFDRKTGEALVEDILSRGDSRDPNEMFRAFMGRDPDPSALLRRELGGERVA